MLLSAPIAERDKDVKRKNLYLSAFIIPARQTYDSLSR